MYPLERTQVVAAEQYLALLLFCFVVSNGPRGQNWDHFPPGPEVELTAFLVTLFLNTRGFRNRNTNNLLCRMEYSTGSFEDRPTWAVLNRYVASPPQFTTRPSGSRPVRLDSFPFACAPLLSCCRRLTVA